MNPSALKLRRMHIAIKSFFKNTCHAKFILASKSVSHDIS